MKSAHVTYKEILGKAKRMDAPVHLSTGNHARRLIAHSPYPILKIGDASQRIWHAGRWRRVYVSNPDHGITLLGSSAILKENLENEKLVSLKYTDDLEDKRLKAGWILISRSGTIGNCAFTNGQHAQKLASEHVIRINPNNILRPGLIYAYLASQYGYAMLTQGTFGSVIQHIEPQHVESIPIPRFPESFQKEVDDLIQEAARLREEAADDMEKAKTIIESFFKCVMPLSFPRRISSKDILASHNKRFEANYHISSGRYYEDYIKNNFEWKEVGDICESISRPDIFKRYYVKNGYMFLGISHIMLAIPQSEKRLSKTKTSNPQTLMVEEGTILIPRSGTIGDVAYATSQHAQKLVSEHVIRARPNNILRGGYVYAFLASSIGKALLQRAIFGSVIQHIESPHIARIPIPIIGQEKMLEIDDLVKTYGAKLGRSGDSELKAISMVEQEIERWSRH